MVLWWDDFFGEVDSSRVGIMRSYIELLRKPRGLVTFSIIIVWNGYKRPRRICFYDLYVTLSRNKYLFFLFILL